MEGLELLIRKSFERLSGADYAIGNVFRPEGYDWPGDWEGRALLAFSCHARMGKEIACKRQMLELLPQKTQGRGYFGNTFDRTAIDEQQLAGHNWLLRGLLSCADAREKGASEQAELLMKNLFLPALDFYEMYPLGRKDFSGGVSGQKVQQCGNWILSSDAGCAFIALDGVAEYYARTKDSCVKSKMERAIARFSSFDFCGLHLQTHATLSALRGVLTFYETTKDVRFLSLVSRIFQLYIDRGMTLSYENFNWFEKTQNWTEPCAVVDSLILAIKLYRITGEQYYRTLARRICFNGLYFSQRENGGAGPNTCVTAEQPYLRVFMYEAPFCCTMRYAEGLVWCKENEELFGEENAPIVKNRGRFFLGDHLLVQDETGTFKREKHYNADGKSLIAIPTLNNIKEETAKKVSLKVYWEES